MVRLSVLGQEVAPVAGPTTEPVCPVDGCDGEMASSGGSVQTMTIPMNGGTLMLLRCGRCREARWYKLSNAYSLMPEDLTF